MNRSSADAGPRKNQLQLPLQFAGSSARELEAMVLGAKLQACCVYEGQCLRAAWGLTLEFDRRALDFYAVHTVVSGWDEVGSLVVRDQGIAPHGAIAGKRRLDIEDFRVTAITIMVHEDDDVRSEAGLCLYSEAGAVFAIAASVSPGSVSVHAPGLDTAFYGEYAFAHYVQHALSAASALAP